MSAPVRTFLAELDPVSAPGALPLELEVVAMTGARALDVLLFLAFIGLVFGLGAWLRAAALPRLRPVVLTACVLAAVMFFAFSSTFWQLSGIALDEDGVTMKRHVQSDVRLAWDEIHTIRFDSGRLFPLVMDDASLVLADAEGDRAVVIPRFLPGAAEAAAWVERLAPPTALVPP